MRVVVASALLLTFGLGGCSVSFRFGKPPRAPTGPFRTEDCVWKHSLQLRPAWSSAQRERNPDAGVNRARQSRAWTFYRGGQRVSAEDALLRLRDKKLHRDYRALWTGAARRGRNRVLGSAVGLAAAALLGITGGVLLHDWPPSRNGSLSDAARNRAVVGFVLIGVAAVSAVILPFVMKTGYRDARAGEAFRTLFISKQHAPSLRLAVVRHNQRVREACLRRFSAAP